MQKKLYINAVLVTDLIIPNSTTSIGNSAFIGCTSLTSVTIPDSVISIGNYAFRYCTSLTSVTIPDSVTSIGSYAFDECSSLNRVNITDISSWCNISFSNEISTSTSNPLYYAKKLYINGELVIDLVLPNGVTSIGDYAFYNCRSLTSVTIPDSVKSIGKYAFSRCQKLADVYYTGSEDEWKNISIGEENDCLINANIHYNSIPKCSVHSYNKGVVTKSATCTAAGKKTYTCTVCGATKTETIKAKGHTVVTDKAVKATYAKAGKTEGSHCKTCGKVIVAQKTVAKLTVPKITLSSVKSKKSKQITVSWKKNTKVTGYEIQYATNSGFTKNKKTVTISKNSTTSKTITKLKGKTKYYIRIRAYKTENGKKYYSSWSSAKSVTTKK